MSRHNVNVNRKTIETGYRQVCWYKWLSICACLTTNYNTHNGGTDLKKIFVVEDDESICDELVQILENEGYEAESLKNFDNT